MYIFISFFFWSGSFAAAHELGSCQHGPYVVGMARLATASELLCEEDDIVLNPGAKMALQTFHRVPSAVHLMRGVALPAITRQRAMMANFPQEPVEDVLTSSGQYVGAAKVAA